MSSPSQILKHKVSLLEASNAELQRELQERRDTCESLKQRACDVQVFISILCVFSSNKCWEF